jgi:hypothetical protein
MGKSYDHNDPHDAAYAAYHDTDILGRPLPAPQPWQVEALESQSEYWEANPNVAGALAAEQDAGEAALTHIPGIGEAINVAEGAYNGARGGVDWAEGDRDDARVAFGQAVWNGVNAIPVVSEYLGWSEVLADQAVAGARLDGYDVPTVSEAPGSAVNALVSREAEDREDRAMLQAQLNAQFLGGDIAPEDMPAMQQAIDTPGYGLAMEDVQAEQSDPSLDHGFHDATTDGNAYGYGQAMTEASANDAAPDYGFHDASPSAGDGGFGDGGGSESQGSWGGGGGSESESSQNDGGGGGGGSDGGGGDN